MRIEPIQPSYRSSDKDERHAAEERRIKLLLDLLREMDVPKERRTSLMIDEKQAPALSWLQRNLAVRNLHHKNYSRANNLITLLLKKHR
ncbi:MAG TPA: hypothetical protein EYQ00_08295 [Dehalococcoidia bacterium]|jgi:hypothetical protein|nr:hypothetical protein [Dehalococcoidia bacterium]